MSVAKLLDHLQMGDVIIVRGGAVALPSRFPAAPRRAGAVEGKAIVSRGLLRNLIAVRKVGGKK
jgi:hypothetical protein